MRQQRLAQTGFERHRKVRRREWFLREMDRIVPWQRLNAMVAPHCAAAECGKQRDGLERMLQVCCLGYWYNLPDRALEEVLYDIEATRRFVGIDLGREAAPDETRIRGFRHLLEDNNLGAALFAGINTAFAVQGACTSDATIVDAHRLQRKTSAANVILRCIRRRGASTENSGHEPENGYACANPHCGRTSSGL